MDRKTFIGLPDEEKPFFMQIIMPMEKKKWQKMLDIAKKWTQADEDSADAWYYLGYAQEKLGNLDFAKLFLNQAYKLNNRHLESLVELYDISVIQIDPKESKRILGLIEEINPERADYISKNS
jgi:serine protease Do